jgi:hypothetical protein
MMYYLYDPTMDTNAMRGDPRAPFGNGSRRFYNDPTLRYQAPRMGNLYGALGATPAAGGASLPFTVVTLPSGMTKATPDTMTMRAKFSAVQFAANSAARRLGLKQQIKVTSEIDPATVELVLTLAQHMPTHPVLAQFAKLAAMPEAAIMTGPTTIAVRVAQFGDVTAALNAIPGTGMSRGAKIVLGGAVVAALVAGGVYMRRAYA